MIEKPVVRRAAILTACAVLFLAGCTGKSLPSRFYALTPLVDRPPVSSQAEEGRGIAIGIGPVRIADYLNQSSIVTRQGNRVEEAPFDQWAGTFEDNLTNVLAENLGQLLATDRIFIYPWRSFAPVDYQVMLDIVRLDGRPGGEVVLVARWSIVSGKEKEILVMHRSEIREPAGTGGCEGMVAAQSRALAGLSNEISAAILALDRDRRP